MLNIAEEVLSLDEEAFDSDVVVRGAKIFVKVMSGAAQFETMWYTLKQGRDISVCEVSFSYRQGAWNYWYH